MNYLILKWPPVKILRHYIHVAFFNFNIDILRKVIFFLVFSISFSYDKCFPCYMINVPRCSSAGLDSGERAG